MAYPNAPGNAWSAFGAGLGTLGKGLNQWNQQNEDEEERDRQHQLQVEQLAMQQALRDAQIQEMQDSQAFRQRQFLSQQAEKLAGQDISAQDAAPFLQDPSLKHLFTENSWSPELTSTNELGITRTSPATTAGTYRVADQLTVPQREALRQRDESLSQGRVQMDLSREDQALDRALQRDVAGMNAGLRQQDITNEQQWRENVMAPYYQQLGGWREAQGEAALQRVLAMSPQEQSLFRAAYLAAQKNPRNFGNPEAAIAEAWAAVQGLQSGGGQRGAPGTLPPSGVPSRGIPRGPR